MLNTNISKPLGNESRTSNILEHKTPRCSTVSNTPLSSNSFAARRDHSIHRRLWGWYSSVLDRQFCDADLEVAFRKSTCYIRDLKGNDLLTAIATACFTQNRSLVIPRHEKTPYHIINARKPSVKFFHIFGSLCYIVRDGENLDKMKEKGDACIFVGYSTQSKAYRVFNKRTRMIVETIHVNFEELPQMAPDHVSSDPGPQCSTLVLDQDSLSPGSQCPKNVPQVAETVTTSNELELLYSPMFSELLNETSHVVLKSSLCDMGHHLSLFKVDGLHSTWSLCNVVFSIFVSCVMIDRYVAFPSFRHCRGVTDWYQSQIMPPRMRTRSAGRPAVESLGGGTGVRVGRGGRGRRPREGNDERVDELNSEGNDQGLGANGGVEEVNGNVEGANGGAPDFSMIIAQQLQNLLPAMLAQVSNRGNIGNQNGNVVNENVQENVGNVLVNGNRVGCSYKKFLACNPKEYDGKGGAVVLTRWIEKMENV
ncbi:retrovirus-related pol polyprotein from transposon TNT 1-94 [Tanacetum coccineum]